jgi:tRNA modification GTPase
MPVDVYAIDLTQAWRSLGEILGENYTDDLLNELFSKFCLGK